MPFSLYRNRNAKRRRRQITLLTILALLILGGLGLYRDPDFLPTLAERLISGRDSASATSTPTGSSLSHSPAAVPVSKTSTPAASSRATTRTTLSVTDIATPGDATPGDATPSGATPSDATPSDATPEVVTPDPKKSPTKSVAGGAQNKATVSPTELRTASRTDLATEAAPSKGTDKPRSDSEAESRATASPDLETQSPATAKPGPDRLALASGGPFELPAPYLAFSRPFAEGLEQRGSSFYPYGTTGGGEYLLHHGVDIGNPMGTIVRAVGDGEVVFAGTDAEGPAWGARDERYPEGFYGRLVVIRHAEAVEGRPLYSLYGHLSRLLVQRRQHVKAGQAIAAVGSAGIALGPHLHLEFRSAAQDYMATLNPELYVANLDGLGLIVGRLTDPAGKPLAKIDIGLYSLGDDGRETWIRQTSSYPSERINSSPGLGENFVFADVEPGRYRVAAVPGGGRLTGDLTVVTGRPSAILLHR